MRILTTVVMVMLMVALTNPAQAYVDIADGVSMGGILQGGLTYNMYDEDEATTPNPGVSWTLNRARFLFKGAVTDNIKWFVQTEMGGVLDAKFIYVCPAAMTTFTLGRFLPAYTYFMPQHTGKLQTINYPLLTQMTAMWRQTGVQTSTKFGGMFDLNLGLFNGATDVNNTAEWTGDGKDILARFNLNMGDIGAGFYFWGLNMIGVDDGDCIGNRMGFFGKYSGMGLNVIAEYLMTSDNIEGVDADDAKAAGYFAHLGYKFMGEKLEALLRYEAWDANTDVDDDEINWITLGLNYYLSGLDSMFYLNYIMKGEAKDFEFDNDQVVLQYQILF